MKITFPRSGTCPRCGGPLYTDTDYQVEGPCRNCSMGLFSKIFVNLFAFAVVWGFRLAVFLGLIVILRFLMKIWRLTQE